MLCIQSSGLGCFLDGFFAYRFPLGKNGGARWRPVSDGFKRDKTDAGGKLLPWRSLSDGGYLQAIRMDKVVVMGWSFSGAFGFF